MRILHYYWTQYDDNEKFGGGIRVYLENIIKCQKEKHEIYMLNSGVDYDLKIEPYIKLKKFERNVKQFSIFNSPMLAPSKCSFFMQKIYLEDESLYKVFLEFLKTYGPFDIIHFHSLEGLTLNVLKIREVLSKTKIIMTLHNYYPFCPQVNLWKNNIISCENFNRGKDCVSCMQYIPNSKLVKYSYLITHYLKILRCDKYSELLMEKIKFIYNKNKKYLSYKSKKNKKDVTSNLNLYYEKFRLKNVEYINEYIDTVCCVSNRVKVIAVKMGINPEKCKVMYIGTDFAEKQIKNVSYHIKNNKINIIYMGYMRKDKGFYFFIEALEKMSEKLAKKINITIAAKFDDMDALEKVNNLKNKFNSIKMYNGYSRTQIKNITKNINLGIVPVLWEDNLPQVAMELKSMGIPILASDRGGASELSSSEAFKFKAGNIEDFNKKIKNILDNPTLLDDYYKKHMELKTIREHINLLDDLYNK